jgi:hypothetical protein
MCVKKPRWVARHIEKKAGESGELRSARERLRCGARRDCLSQTFDAPATELRHVHTHAHCLQAPRRLLYVHSVAPEAVNLRHHHGLTMADLSEHLLELRPLRREDRTHSRHHRQTSSRPCIRSARSRAAGSAWTAPACSPCRIRTWPPLRLLVCWETLSE